MRTIWGLGLALLAACGSSSTTRRAEPGGGDPKPDPCAGADQRLADARALRDDGLLRAARVAAQALDPACAPDAPALADAMATELRLEDSLETPDDTAQLEARRLHAEGLEALDAGDWDRAVATLEAAHAIWPHPSILAAQARAHTGAGRADAARLASERALALAERIGGGLGVPRLVEGHHGTVHALVYHPRGRWLAASSGQEIVIWDVVTDKPVQRLLGLTAGVVDLGFQPDGTLVSASLDGRLAFWDIHRGQLLRTIADVGGTVGSMSLSPDGTRAAFALGDEETGEPPMVSVVDVERGVVVWSKAAPDHVVRWTPDGTHLVSGGFILGKQPTRCQPPDDCAPPEIGRVTLWKPADGMVIAQLKLPEAYVSDVAVSHDGTTLAVAGDERVHLWKLGKKPRASRSFTPRSAPGSVSFLADGTILVDGDLHDATGTLLRTVVSVGYPGAIAMRPDGAEVACAVRDGHLVYERRIVIGAIGGGDQRSIGYTEPWDSARGFAFSFGGGRLVVAGGYKAAVFDLATGAAPALLDGGGDWINAAVLSPDEESIAIGGQKRIAVLSRADGVELSRIDQQYWSVAVAYRPDGGALAYGDDRTVEILDVATGASLGQLTGHHIELLSLDWSSDGKRLLSIGHDRVANLWEVGNATPLATWPASSRVGYCGAIRPDGGAFATSARSTEVAVDVVSADGTVETQAPKGEAHSVAWSPDGKTLAAGITSGGERSVRLWRAGSDDVIELPWADGLVDEVAFHPGGRILAGAVGRQLTFWAVESHAVLARLVVADDGSWAVISADGHLDGDPGLHDVELVFGESVTLPAVLDWPGRHQDGLLAKALGR